MAAKWKYGLLCDGAMQVAGKWTFQGVFDNIRASGFPAVHPECAIVAQFCGPVGPHVLRITFTNADGTLIIPEFRRAIECQEFKDNTLVINIQGLVIPKPGFYSFNFYLGEETNHFGIIDLQAIGFKPAQS